MSKIVQVRVLVEGQTEQLFIKNLLSPYFTDFTEQKIILTPTLGGNQGGDVRFSRYERDIGLHLRQCTDTYVTLMVDYYGIRKDWPGLEEAKRQTTHSKKAEVVNRETAKEVQKRFPEQNSEIRFIPYVSMHEIEALYFSNPANNEKKMNVPQKEVESIVRECGEPEAINDNVQTAPSKRLQNLSLNFKKITTGIDIAKAVGIERMREQCPLFNEWIERMENLKYA
jgi:hypothetical protein